MNASLVVLCLSAFALVALIVSGLVAAAMPWLDRLAAMVTPRRRARLWFGLAALPSAVGLLAVGVSLLPVLGIGHDHCLAHGPHHPHLCPYHMHSTPGMFLVFFALLPAVRMAQVVAALGWGLRASRDTSDALAQISDRRGDALVFPSDEPQAFVLGALRPRVHISRGLLALGRHIVEPVLAHERVHAQRRDLLWRALCPLVALGHLPGTTEALRARLAAAQEMAADAEAAEAVTGGRLQIAETLLLLARLSRVPSPGISFTHGNIESRVHALLESQPGLPGWPVRALLLTALLLAAAVGVSHDLVHHGLEMLLGALS